MSIPPWKQNARARPLRAVFRLPRLPGAAARAKYILLAERLAAFEASPQEKHET
jgi:hypothetical protein